MSLLRSTPPVQKTHASLAPALPRSLAKEAQEMFSSAVRTTLSACRGYECQEKDGIFMLAFADAGARCLLSSRFAT